MTLHNYVLRPFSLEDNSLWYRQYTMALNQYLRELNSRELSQNKKQVIKFLFESNLHLAAL